MNRRAVLFLSFIFTAASLPAGVVLSNLIPNLVCFYDFEHPAGDNAGRERDLGFSGADINLINGGAVMRVNGGAYAGSSHSLQTQQINPDTSGNDDWKAGIYQTNGIVSLNSFASVPGITLMGWVRPTGTNPSLNPATPATNDFYNAVGLFGLLSGNSEGHGVRALLEVINVSGTLRLVALGRRVDGGNSLTLAATNDWQALLPSNTWTHLAATFDFDNGNMALHRNGVLIEANYTTGGDAWGVLGGVEPDLTSATSPAGIKIGGSYPQNTQEFNAFNGRFDDLMFFNRKLTDEEVQAQYDNFSNARPMLLVTHGGNQLVLSWPLSAAGFSLESQTNLSNGGWFAVGDTPATNGEILSITRPIYGIQTLFRLRKP